MKLDRDIPTSLVKPAGYRAPSFGDIKSRMENAGLLFKGESVPWGIAPEPTILPTSFGRELANLGDSLEVAYDTEVWLLSHGPKKERELTEAIVRTHVPGYIPTGPETLDKRQLRVMRPDVVITSERSPEGIWRLKAGIAEVETRPAGTYVTPTLMEGYGMDYKGYMNRWVEYFGERPWAAVYPKEWELYTGELNAFGTALENHGGKNAGVYCVDDMTTQDIAETIPTNSFVYLFGYVDVFARSGSLDKVKRIDSNPDTIAYNPLHYPYETKASLTLFKQPWFLEMLAKKFGSHHAELLNKWLIESYALNIRADQNFAPDQVLKNRRDWILKRAGFSRDATESRGLIFPDDKNHLEEFAGTIEQAISGQDGPWVTQRFLRSRVPQAFYRPDNGEIDHFSGAMRLTPIYVSERKNRATLVGCASTVTFGSERAHGGSGAEIKPGMSVMTPIMFDDETQVQY